MRSGSPRSILRRQRGFTLPELMTSITVFGLVAAAVSSVVVGTLGSVSYQAHVMDAQLDVTSAMALFQDDLRAAGYEPDSINQPVFQQVTTGTTSDSIQFVGDVNSDGVSERITYAVVNGNLMRTQDVWNGGNGWNTGTAQPVAANVTKFSLTFNYVDPCTAVISTQTATQVLNPMPLCSSQCTSFVSITLTGTGTYKGQTVVRTLTSDVTERQQNVLPVCS